MKPMNENNNNNSANWLGFSLSNQMNMEANQAQPTSSSPLPSSVQNSFYLSPHHFNNSAICYGVGSGGGGGENAAGFYSNQLSVMPLNSDGSLCLMEALTRSQQKGMVASQSPKLEDFLGCGPNMGTHDQFANSDREAMALSLDSMFYTQNPESEHHRNQSLELLQQPFNQQFSYYQPLVEEEEEQMGGEHEFSTNLMKNWANGFGDLHPLSLSMSPGTQSSCVTVQNQVSSECLPLDSTKKRGAGKGAQKQPVHRKSIDTFGQRTSQYRGVTRHRWTGRYEAHLWDNSCKKEGQTRKGRQVYLGGYDMEDKAARAYDLAALKYWGPSSHINFPLDNYRNELEEMKNMSRQEYVAHLRRKSSGFSRGASIYRGVTRHHQHGRWQARIGRVSGNKDLYLGTFSTQEEAAEAYDIAAIKFRGLNAVTNFDITKYDVERIMASNTLLPIEFARRSKAIVVHNSNRELQLTSDQIENQPFSTDHHLNGFVGVESANSVPRRIDNSEKTGSARISNSSSLVTSLSSSAEASPDRGGLPILFGKPPPLGSWFPIAQVPVFAAWTDHD